MLYLSKGVVCNNSTDNQLRITRGNTVITISGMEAGTWLEGRFEMTTFAGDTSRTAIVKELANKGLAEYEECSDPVGQYRILSRCICCPAKTGLFHKRLSKTEKAVLEWLTKAGIRLSTAELIFLAENKIKPIPSLLYEENRQTLIETIYTQNNIFDNILENQMEKAVCRNEMVSAILKLLYKRRIVML